MQIRIFAALSSIPSAATNFEYKSLTCAAEGVFFARQPRTALLSGFPDHHKSLMRKPV